MSISVLQKSIVNMAGSNRPMDTALKTVSEASIHVTKSDQNLTGKNHIGSESSSRKNSTVENSSGELHTTASMNNVRSSISVIFDESNKVVSTSKAAGVGAISSNTNSLASTADQSGVSPQSGLLVQRIQTADEAVVGNLVNGPGTIPAKARKSSFQITRVSATVTPGGTDQMSTSGSQAGSVLDTMDDADDTTPNTGSEGHDISRSTADLSEDTETSADTLRSPNSEPDGDTFLTSTTGAAVYDQILPRIVVPTSASPAAVIQAMAGLPTTANGSTNGKSSSSPVTADIQSRFKIVKILNRVRGRWKCLDFAGPPMSAAESAGSKSDSPSTGVVVQLQRMQDSSGTLIDVSQLVSSVPHTLDGSVGMSQNFYRMPDTNTTLSQIAGTVRSSSDPAFAIGGGGVAIDRAEANCDPNNQTLLNPAARGAESIDDTTESSIDAAGSFALDNKIEQAMVRYNDRLDTLDYKISKSLDLVKSHLMFAVHEEVELLKEQIKELTIKNGQLEYENTVLRASATSETLAKLQPPPSAPHTGLS